MTKTIVFSVPQDQKTVKITNVHSDSSLVNVLGSFFFLGTSHDHLPSLLDVIAAQVVVLFELY